MNKSNLRKLVTKTVALHLDVAEKTEQIKALRSALVEEAGLHSGEHIATESGGKRWTAEGRVGSVARVSLPAATLVSELDAKRELAEQCKAIAGAVFRTLFTPV